MFPVLALWKEWGIILSKDGNAKMKNKLYQLSHLLRVGSIFLLIFCLAGCGASDSGAGKSGTQSAAEKTTENATENISGDSTNTGEENNNKKAGTDTSSANTSVPDYYHKGELFLPQADGKVTEEHEGVKFDLSHTDQGYFMVAYSGSATKLMVQVQGSDNIPYRYYFDPDGEYNALPFTAGNGNYAVTAYENVGDNRYAVVFTKTIDVMLENEVLPFLYSSQYVNFDENTKAVAKAKELTEGKTELEAVQAVYKYVVDNIVYDDEKAATVKSGYLPNVDETLKTKKGICFDYAALMTAMIRSSGIPTRLDIGYATDIYHAWISTYLEEQGWVDNVIKFDGKNWTMMDPTFAAGGGDGIQDFITDSSNYNIQYVH